MHVVGDPVRSSSAAPRYRRILVPLDGSELSEAALPHAEALARLSGAELILLRAYAPPVEPEPAPILLAGPDRRAQVRAATAGRNRRHAADRHLAGAADRLRGKGIAAAVVPAAGPAGEVIVLEANARQADLIVMATHARTGVDRFLAGSVADHVLRHASCPVYLVHPLRG